MNNRIRIATCALAGSIILAGCSVAANINEHPQVGIARYQAQMHQDDLALVMLVFIFFATSVLAVATLLIMSMRERDYHAHIERMAQFRSTTMQPQYWPYHILDQSGQQYMIDASGKLYELPEPRR